MPARFADRHDRSIPITILDEEQLPGWLAQAGASVQAWVTASGFKAKLGSCLLLPDHSGLPQAVLFGWGNNKCRNRGRFHFAKAAEKLVAGTYHIKSGLQPDELDQAALGWLLAAYRFDRYKSTTPATALLQAPDGVDVQRLEAIARAEFLCRDLINTPANDMGPAALETAFRALAKPFRARISVTSGEALLKGNFPLIHAVGRASDQQPRLLDLNWGRTGDPKVTLVGKGVCFDTGGLNLKPGTSMALMKKDMGGAATVMGLAHLIMELKLPVRLRVLVPAVENSVSAGAMRPGDVLTSRKGLSVEINNTDAEGRLVLADALALADEEKPDLLISMATLTGAARVALGPDLAPYYTDDATLAEELDRASRKVGDPIWRMPFWDPYEKLIEPDIADLDNAPSGGMAGSITAALFLRRFVENAGTFAHFDIYGWCPTTAPARPKGGAFLAARAIFETLSQKFPN
ncbi:MAG: leucyl aminopeptidase family protein [Rhodobacteraceae bacterium]|nr:leucyl aminopeptidase family protein [Paracoccaceae bacterium]